MARSYSLLCILNQDGVGNGLPGNRSSISWFYISDIMIFPLHFPKCNIIWHKAKAQFFFCFFWSVIHKAMAMNECVGKSRQRLTKVALTMACSQWNWHNIGSSIVHLLNRGGGTLLTSRGNFWPKEIDLVHGIIFYDAMPLWSTFVQGTDMIQLHLVFLKE